MSKRKPRVAMKSRRAIEMELRRVEAMRDLLIRRKRGGSMEFYQSRAFIQALAWVLQQHAAAPSKCFVTELPKKRRSKR